MRVWIVCEAFTLTEDHSTIHDSLVPCAIPCASYEIVKEKLEEAIRNRVSENYEGMRDEKEQEECIQGDIKEVYASARPCGRGWTMYRYSKDDREIVWYVYSRKVEGAE